MCSRGDLADAVIAEHGGFAIAEPDLVVFPSDGCVLEAPTGAAGQLLDVACHSPGPKPCVDGDGHGRFRAHVIVHVPTSISLSYVVRSHSGSRFLDQHRVEPPHGYCV